MVFYGAEGFNWYFTKIVIFRCYTTNFLKGKSSRWRRLSWPAFWPRAAAAVAPRRATGHGQAGGHVRGAARLRVASSRFAVRSSAVLCGEGERKRPLLFSPAGHFRRAVGAALRRM